MLELTRFRYCPSCGKPVLVEHGPKAAECSSCGFIYYHNTASSVAAIIEVGDTILLTVRAHAPKAGLYDCAGGFVDYGESVEEACSREIREELGVAVEIREFLGSFPNRYEYRSVTYHTTDIFLVCRVADSAAVVNPSDELAGVEYFAPQNIPFDRLAFASNVLALREYVRRKNGAARLS